MGPILVIDPEAEAFAGALRARLPGREVLTRAPPEGTPVPYLVTGTPPKGLIGGLAGLQLVLSLNAGVDRLLAQEDLPVGVRLVKMADDGLRTGMAEWVLAHVLAWHRNLWVYQAQQEQGVWRRRPERLARERRVVLLGAGSLARAAAGALRSMNFQAQMWGRTPGERDGVLVHAGERSLEDLLTGADVLINLLPLTAQTRGLVGRSLFGRLSPHALFINAGRGATVIEADLLEALRAGPLELAVLDVFPVEPLAPGHPFWSHPRVRVSPHAAAVTRPDTACEAVAASILAHERGAPAEHLVDPLRGY